MDNSSFLTPLGIVIWEDRYALKDENGNLIEKTIFDTFRRVSTAIAKNEKDHALWADKFYNLLSNKQFSPAGRILAHAGTHYSQLLNCFVLPFRDDSLEEIMHTASDMAIVQKLGGGTGFNYSTLRPSGCYIKGVNGRSCGVIGFLSMMSVISEVIEQGGSRRGANLGLLEVWHPDIWEFISYKTNHNWDRLLEYVDIKDPERWASFKYENLYKWQMYNVSVGITDEFLNAVKKDEEWPLQWKGTEWYLYSVAFKKLMPDKTYSSKIYEVVADNEKTAIWKLRKIIPYPTSNDIFEVTSKRRIRAKELWDRICYNAWADGCPGLINLSTVRRMHNLEYARPVLAANPCAEQMLPALSACLLGSMILPTFVVDGKFDFDSFREAIHTSIRFMDNVIDICSYPLPEIEKIELLERRIGLGTMGVHDMLIALKLGYDTDEGRAAVKDVLEFLRDEAYRASIELAKEKGSFPLLNKDKYLQSGFIKTLPNSIRADINKYGIRNGCILSQAPTGTIGTMYNISTGCEPWFDLYFQRNTRLGSYEDGCPAFLKWKKDNPDKVKPSYFKTAQEISVEDHIKMMALFSRYIDSSVSKTVNLPSTATVEDVKRAFILGMESGIKGLTVFRDACKEAVLVRKPEEVVSQDVKESKVPDDIDNNIETNETRLDPKYRGNRTIGATYRVHMQKHNLYVTVNRNYSGNFVEVFATVGENKKENTRHTSGVEDSWAEGLGKIISLALRAGVMPESIIRNLKNIPSDKPVFTNIGDSEQAELIPSPPHAIARVMEEELKYEMAARRKTEPKKTGGQCEKCGSENIRWKTSTCYECLDCSYSRCQNG